MNSLIGNFTRMLTQGTDGALLRFSLGSAYLKAGEFAPAIEHLEQAVTLDEGYSAAWKVLGQAQQTAGLVTEAMSSYRRGIAIAESKGDIQAAKEMRVFLKRAQRQHAEATEGSGCLTNQTDR